VRAIRAGFALEYALGHITHAENLKGALPEGIVPHYVEIPYTVLPHLKNWSLRASLYAWHRLRAAGPLDRLFYHTQITTLFAAPLLRRTPGVVSLDATPLQMDILGAAYGHRAGSARTEALKKRLLMRTLGAAKHIVTWSQWTKDSLVTDYGQPEAKILVLPPGVQNPPLLGGRGACPKGIPGAIPRCLFVGGDFTRKGGEELLAAWKLLQPDARLDIVTQSDVKTDLPGVTVHRGVKPNSPELKALFACAELFVFPTRADCLPLAVLEAAAAGLPVITTGVGALPEAVIDGQTGRIVPVGDVAALTGALGELLENPERRQEMGQNARSLACNSFDAAKNYRKLGELIAGNCR
jgi:glycosyltransferase involved in cell wall biosynthesis